MSLDDQLAEGRAAVAQPDRPGDTDGVIAAIQARNRFYERRARMIGAAGVVVATLLVSGAVLAAARTSDESIDVAMPDTSAVAAAPATTTSTAPAAATTTSAARPTDASAVPTTRTSGHPTPTTVPPRTTIVLTTVPPASDTAIGGPPAAPPTTNLTVRRPADNPHPDPLPGATVDAGTLTTTWQANVPPRYTYRVMVMNSGEWHGPSDVTVEMKEGKEQVTASVDANTGAPTPEPEVNLPIGVILDVAAKVSPTSDLTVTAASGTAVDGVPSVIDSSPTDDNATRVEVSGFWVE